MRPLIFLEAAYFLLPVAHRPFDFAVDLVFLDRAAFVVLLLAAADADLYFHFALFEVHRQRDERGAFDFEGFFQFLAFAFVDQQLAFPPRVVVVDDGGLGVRVDVAVDQVQLALADLRERVVNLAEAGAQAFDFGPHEDDAALDFVLDEVVVVRPPIGDAEQMLGLGLVLGHRGIVRRFRPAITAEPVRMTKPDIRIESEGPMMKS